LHCVAHVSHRKRIKSGQERSPITTVFPSVALAATIVAACSTGADHSQAPDSLDGAAVGIDGGGAGDAVAAREASVNSDATLSDQSSEAALHPEASSAPPDATTSDDPAETSTFAEASTRTEASTVTEAGTTGPGTCGYTPCVPGAPCPDLAVDANDLVRSVVISTKTFPPTDCAIAEGCVTQSGARRLLRFDTATENIGNADLVVGSPLGNACFQFSTCHMHYHFQGVGRYTLYQSDGTTVAAVGHKQGFCLDDVTAIPSLTPPPTVPARPFDCGNQGVHVGFEDIYPNDIDCQWIDITDVPPGSYVLSVVINGDHYLPESNYDNNEARVPVMIPPQ
jgi:hypothetical protein